MAENKQRSPRRDGGLSALGVHPVSPSCQAGLSHPLPEFPGGSNEVTSAPVSLGVHDKAPRMRGLNNTQSLRTLWRLDVPDPPAAGLVPPQTSPGRADGRLLPGSSQGRPCMCVYVLVSSTDEDPSHTGVKSTVGTTCHLNHLFKTLLQVQSCSEVLGFGRRHSPAHRDLCATCTPYKSTDIWKESLKE